MWLLKRNGSFFARDGANEPFLRFRNRSFYSATATERIKSSSCLQNNNALGQIGNKYLRPVEPSVLPFRRSSLRDNIICWVHCIMEKPVIPEKGNCELQRRQRDDILLTTRVWSTEYKYWPLQSAQSSVSPAVESEYFFAI